MIAMITHFERLMEKAMPRATQLVKVLGGVEAMVDSPLIEQDDQHHINLEKQIKSSFRFTRQNERFWERFC